MDDIVYEADALSLGDESDGEVISDLVTDADIDMTGLAIPTLTSSTMPPATDRNNTISDDRQTGMYSLPPTIDTNRMTANEMFDVEEEEEEGEKDATAAAAAAAAATTRDLSYESIQYEADLIPEHEVKPAKDEEESKLNDSEGKDVGIENDGANKETSERHGKQSPPRHPTLFKGNFVLPSLISDLEDRGPVHLATERSGQYCR